MSEVKKDVRVDTKDSLLDPILSECNTYIRMNLQKVPVVLNYVD